MENLITSIPGIISILGIIGLLISHFGFAKKQAKTDKTTFIIQIIISIIVLSACFYIILSKSFGIDTQKWAFGMVGLVVGFWLKT